MKPAVEGTLFGGFQGMQTEDLPRLGGREREIMEILCRPGEGSAGEKVREIAEASPSAARGLSRAFFRESPSKAMLSTLNLHGLELRDEELEPLSAQLMEARQAGQEEPDP